MNNPELCRVCETKYNECQLEKAKDSLLSSVTPEEGKVITQEAIDEANTGIILHLDVAAGWGCKKATAIKADISSSKISPIEALKKS
jgi:hypothetical protein